MEPNSFLENDRPVEFLYLDKNRIASLIGQMSQNGVLTGLTSTYSKTISNEGDAKGKLAIVELEGKHSRASQQSSQETYDPFWTHAYSFLRDLEATFAAPLDKARLGSLVKFDGFLQFVDLKIMRSLWGPIAEAYFAQQGATSVEGKLGLEIIKDLPHLLHMTFLAESDRTVFRFWAALKPECMTISSEDLTMKFGAVVDGRWTVVGIVDARIGEPPSPSPVNALLDGVITSVVAIRELFGRPKDHWGITPIAIYTPMTGLAEIEAAEASSGSPEHL